MNTRSQSEQGMGPWWMLSLVLHLCLFASLLLFLPSPPAVLRSETSAGPSAASPEKVRQVAEDIRARESESLLAKVNELQRVREEMGEFQNEAFDHLNELNRKKAEEAQERAQGQSAGTGAAEAIPAKHPEKSEIGSAKTVPELYDMARRIEEALAASYQDARAAELAAIQNLPIGEARKLTETTRPVRPELDNEALTGDTSDAAGLQRQEQQILTARREVAGMLAQANSILRQVRPSEGGVSVTAESLESRGKQAREMESAALADGGTPARDLSGLMAKGSGTGKVPQEPLTGPMDSAASRPPPPPSKFESVPGRLLVSGPASVEKGRDGSWMFLDSWYLIGPWPNKGRRNLNTKFPPESIINLDAFYENESGKKLGWKFHQSGKEIIVPPGLGEYQIYYGFTELRSEIERDCWIAIGSDDQSKVWVNDQLVWKSSDILKGWNPGEGLRKIHLNSGINRILVRLENGHMSGGFSIIVKIEN